MSKQYTIDAEEMLVLNKLTGLVHNYDGTVPGGYGGDPGSGGIGVAPCGCDGELFEESVMTDHAILIKGKHLEAGVWEPAPCLCEDESSEKNETDEHNE